MGYLHQVVHLFFIAYTVLLFARIMLSWVPMWQGHELARFVVFYADPYLNLFRRVLPPLGGVLDLSPVLAFFVLQIIERIFHMGLQWLS